MDRTTASRPERVVAAGALACAGLALLDPSLGALLFPAAVLSGVGLIRGRGGARVAALLAAVWTVAAVVGPGMPADSWSYYAWLRSLAFDGDIDFRNEWAEWGLRRGTPGHPTNPFSIGPALTWSPFFALAHAWVVLGRLLGRDLYAADGFSAPYVRAAALGSLTVLVLGSVLLVRGLGRLADRGAAAVAVSAAVLGSPIAYYALLAPAMSHAVACGAAAVVLALWLETRERPSARRWVALGAAFGWLVVCRWQAAVLGLLPALLALQQWRARTLRPAWLGAAAAAALVLTTPQLLAWRVLYGRFLTMPQGQGFVDWTSPHLVDVLVSADHGLLLTPVVVLGLAGLFVPGALPATLRWGGLAVFAAAAWTNGGVWDPTGGDAVGARRFDFTVPLAAAGLVEVVRRSREAVRRRPLLAPALVLGIFVAWNLGLTRLAARGRYRETPAPVERVAANHLRDLRRAAENAAEWLGGPPARALVYKALVGEYLYQARHLDGTLDLVRLEESELDGGWSEAHRQPGGPGFRWARYPEACLLLPLEEPIDLTMAITARAPAGTQPQTLALRWNGVTLGAAPLGTAWQVLRFEAPARFGVPGENRLCLAFDRALPSESGPGTAAAVARVQLP